jgi:hypothetical protein
VSVSADGQFAVVGAYVRDQSGVNSAGGAFVYYRDAAGEWALDRELFAPDVASSDQFGFAVAVSGDGSTVVVGAPRRATTTRCSTSCRRRRR